MDESVSAIMNSVGEPVVAGPDIDRKLEIRLVLTIDPSVRDLILRVLASLVGGSADSAQALPGSERQEPPVPSVSGTPDAAPVPAYPMGSPLPIPSVTPPAVDPHDSIQPDGLICLEDGKRMTMLKRYIRSRYGLTPEQYKARWGLPADYPMVAPRYAIQRSDIARRSGLGRNGRGGRRRASEGDAGASPTQG